MAILWLIVAAMTDSEENSKILGVNQTKTAKWSRMTVEVRIQATKRNVNLVSE